VDVQSGGTLLAGNTNGTGILTVGALNFGDSPSAITTNLFSVVSRGMVSATRLSVSGKSLVCILDNSLPLGTNTLLNYTGTIGGVGFGGFALVSTPVVPSGAGAYLRNTGAALQLVVAPLTAPTLNRAVSKSGGALGLSFTGVNGQSFRVLSSTNLILPLTNWLTLTNGTFGAGQIDFLDSSATNDEQFYRVASP
jgi:hypothetical protein